MRESVKDIDGLTEVFQVPVDGPQTVPQLIGAPVQLIPAHLTPINQSITRPPFNSLA